MALTLVREKGEKKVKRIFFACIFNESNQRLQVLGGGGDLLKNVRRYVRPIIGLHRFHMYVHGGIRTYCPKDTVFCALWEVYFMM